LLLVDGGIGDNHHRSEALRLMEELTMQGVAIVIATRDMARVRSLAARAFTLASGKLTEVSLATHAVERSLELSVSSPIPDYERLSTRIHGVIRRGDRLHIPLGHHSPEEILSHCRTLGIAVNHSRVVAAHHWV
jgi:energy-coupling factor transporter ATP-binding protein EcfA2